MSAIDGLLKSIQGVELNIDDICKDTTYWDSMKLVMFDFRLAAPKSRCPAREHGSYTKDFPLSIDVITLPAKSNTIEICYLSNHFTLHPYVLHVMVPEVYLLELPIMGVRYRIAFKHNLDAAYDDAKRGEVYANLNRSLHDTNSAFKKTIYDTALYLKGIQEEYHKDLLNKKQPTNAQ